jgi:hypothetical protein
VLGCLVSILTQERSKILVNALLVELHSAPGKFTVSRYTSLGDSLLSDLAHQAMDATNGHAQASPPLTLSDPRLVPIVNFEMGLTTAQAFSNRAGLLNAKGANGGRKALLDQPFFITINSSVHALLPQFEQPGGLVTPGDGQFSPAIFNTFEAWSASP